jgi:hypothetical protein
MKKIGVIGIAILISFKGHSQIDCQKFRNGTFYYPGMPGKISIRTDSIQKSYNDGRLEMLWKVNWITECTYELVCQKMLVNTYTIRPGDRFIANIIATDDSCFTTSLIFYSKESPEGEKIPGGPLCIKKNE